MYQAGYGAETAATIDQVCVRILVELYPQVSGVTIFVRQKGHSGEVQIQSEIGWSIGQKHNGPPVRDHRPHERAHTRAHRRLTVGLHRTS